MNLNTRCKHSFAHNVNNANKYKEVCRYRHDLDDFYKKNLIEVQVENMPARSASSISPYFKFHLDDKKFYSSKKLARDEVFLPYKKYFRWTVDVSDEFLHGFGTSRIFKIEFWDSDKGPDKRFGKVKFYSAFKNVGPAPKFGHFWRFWE